MLIKINLITALGFNAGAKESFNLTLYKNLVFEVHTWLELIIFRANKYSLHNLCKQHMDIYNSLAMRFYGKKY